MGNQRQGKLTGAQTAEVEVSAIIDVQPFSLYTYAAFADDTGCNALQFKGKASTDSYDSSTLNPANPVPVFGQYDGNVGTNGNLFENGGSVINGSLSTPREGVGACSANNVTGASIVGNGTTVSDGLTKISEIDYPTPVIPAPGTGSQNIKPNDGCNGGVPYCTPAYDKASPPNLIGGKITAPAQPNSSDPNSCDATTCVELGDVRLSGGATLQLTAGTYVVNSINVE